MGDTLRRAGADLRTKPARPASAHRCDNTEMPLLTLYVNNKAGGLIYHRVSAHATLRTPFVAAAPSLPPHTSPSLASQDFSKEAAKLDTNEQLRLASTFNGLAMIMKELSPVPRSGRMELLEADSFVLQSFDTATGLKFFITADPESKHLDQARRHTAVASPRCVSLTCAIAGMLANSRELLPCGTTGAQGGVHSLLGLCAQEPVL